MKYKSLGFFMMNRHKLFNYLNIFLNVYISLYALEILIVVKLSFLISLSIYVLSFYYLATYIGDFDEKEKFQFISIVSSLIAIILNLYY